MLHATIGTDEHIDLSTDQDALGLPSTFAEYKPTLIHYLMLFVFHMAGGIRWSNGANYNDVYDNRIKTDETGDFSIYMCEFH